MLPPRRASALGPGAALVAVLVAAWPAPAADTPATGRHYVLLIGMDRYRNPDVRPLPCTVNDVRELAEVFRKRNAAAGTTLIKELTDETRKGLMDKLPDWLGKATKPEDSVLVYFSGHGFCDDDKRLYLAPVDFDKDRPAETGVAVEWLRGQMAKCKAGGKLLILDACHAGSEKGVAKDGVTAEELAKPLEEAEGVLTLASSKANEKSLPWEAINESLFTYWLIQGLKGHADANADGVVDFHELYKYVHANVTRTAPLVAWGRKQTPVYIRGANVEGVPEVFRPRPQKVQELLNDVAEQLSLCLGQTRLEQVGVLDFVGDSGLGEYGAVGRRCAAAIEDRLAGMKGLGDGKVRIAGHRDLQKALAGQKFTVGDLADAGALRKLSKGLGGSLALVEGEIRGRDGRYLDLRCKLSNAETREELGRAGGRAAMTENDWALLGRSAFLPRDEDPDPPDDPKKPGPAPGGEGQVVEKLEQKAKKPHPFTDPNFPFRVRIMVTDPDRAKDNPRERPGAKVGNDWVVELNEGEEYEIVIDHPVKAPVIMRLLVDGLNTLPEPSPDKGIVTLLWGKPVNLDDAKYWILDPEDGKVRKSRVPGFFTRTGTDAEFKRFTVAKAEESLAARQQFTEQIGLITVAFYFAVPSGARGQVGTRAGREGRTSIESMNVRPGDLIGVAHIRYHSKE